MSVDDDDDDVQALFNFFMGIVINQLWSLRVPFLGGVYIK